MTSASASNPVRCLVAILPDVGRNNTMIRITCNFGGTLQLSGRAAALYATHTAGELYGMRSDPEALAALRGRCEADCDECEQDRSTLTTSYYVGGRRYDFLEGAQ